MKKNTTTVFVCDNCGNESKVWQGQCKVCSQWNTFKEIKVSPFVENKLEGFEYSNPKVEKLSGIDLNDQERITTGIEELDRTLSGGLVNGQAILFGGNPGIGKSTLLMQLAGSIKKKILYLSGEESAFQVAGRAERLNVKEKDNIDIISTNDLSVVFESFNHDLLIVDSIQTVSLPYVESSAGSVSQVKECAFKLIQFAKQKNIPVFIVGHITKEGEIAGPKILEHMVDTVLYMEGDKNHIFRLVKVVKNRYGDDAEVGIFEMKSDGLYGVKNPSEVILKERNLISSGSATAMILEGSRPIAVEIQALTTKTNFGYPKRAASGFSLSRLQLLCAVIQKHLRIDLSDQDIYLNIASGINVREPSADLAVCTAIISSLKDKPVDSTSIYIAEVGLSGETRNVSILEKRIKEAEKLGFKNIISSKNLKHIKDIHI